MAKTILNSLNGQLKISDQLIVSKNTIPDDIFRHYKTTDTEVRDVNTGFIHYTIRDIELQEKYFFFSFCFFDIRLDMLTSHFQKAFSWIANPLFYRSWITNPDQLANLYR